MNNAFQNYKLPEPQKLAAYEWQDRAATVIKEFQIPKEVTINNKKIGLHAIVFRHFKRYRSQAETFYQYAKTKETPGKYLCYLILNRKKLYG